MLEYFPFYLGIIVAIVLLIMLANRIRVAYPVLLVLAGLAISFVPGAPRIHINPELIFIIFLPPLLYEAAWSISWKELWHWRRIISSFAFVVVFLTAMAVAFVANRYIPGFSLALGFVLGGIVSPPDAVSAGAILRFVKVRRAMASILEGESLLNDASSLIIFRFGLIAVATGQFIWYEATLNFIWMVIGGVGLGLLVGFIFMKAHKLLPTDVNMDIALTIVAPYVMYIAAEEVHSSGVLAVVSGGLLLSNKRHLFLSSTSRLRGVNFWESLVFILNGLVFMFIGLDLPEIVEGLDGTGLRTAIGYGVLITGVLVVGRIIAAYGAVITTIVMRNFITVADTRNPGIRGPFLIGWTGMRGVVSLAAALSIPNELANGQPFPQRNLILFITFVVILLTLVVQGLSLPWFIRLLNVPDLDETKTEEEISQYIRRALAEQALAHVNSTYKTQLNTQPMLQQWVNKWENTRAVDTDGMMNKTCKEIYIDILNMQRQWLLEKNKSKLTLNEEIVRKHLQQLDLEEEKMRFV
ncbi:MAG: Na+/H+ antiporter [Mucilaginibacter polytrichastri]|nr:Na+/H+ antiporter [Mucilaginibacter polytrichastri]